MTAYDFFGDKLELHPDGPGEFAVMEFFEALSDDRDANTPQIMGVQFRLIESGLKDAAEGKKFRLLARKNRAKANDLQPLIKTLLDTEVEHPTSLPSDSTDGQKATQPSSEPKPELVATDLFAGRPDLGLAARRQKRALAKAS